MVKQTTDTQAMPVASQSAEGPAVTEPSGAKRQAPKVARGHRVDVEEMKRMGLDPRPYGRQKKGR